MDPATPAQAPLSEKAKGKRRAIEPDEDDDVSNGDELLLPSPSSTAPTRTFTVRFSEGVHDLEMAIGPNDAVREVQRRVGCPIL